MEKLGRVIGKHGATIKAIEESVGVHIDVDKIHGKIHVRGNESAAEEAVKQLEKLTLAVDEEIEVSADLITYLLTQVCVIYIIIRVLLLFKRRSQFWIKYLIIVIVAHL